MGAEEIEVVIRGGAGDGAYSAAHAAARALVAEGAYVDLHSISRMDAPEPGALRGARVRVRLDEESPFMTGSDGTGKPVEAASPGRSGLGLVRAVKVVIGVVLLLILFGAEIRLHFGLGLDSIITLVGIWAFWQFALWRPATSP